MCVVRDVAVSCLFLKTLERRLVHLERIGRRIDFYPDRANV